MVESYDIQRIASIYSDTEGNRWWTKAWFNGREKGEPAVEISRQMVIAAVKGTITKDDWLRRFYPRQMSICQQSEEETRRQLMGLS